MTLGPIATEVFGAITANTVPVVLDFLTERLKKVLEGKGRKGKSEIEALRKEVEDLRQQLESKKAIEAGDINRVEAQVEKARQVQQQYGLELISDQAHKRWILEQFEKLSELKSVANTFKVYIWTQEGTSSIPRDINIVPKTAPGGYRIGDKITLFFRAERDCYLTLFNLGTSGSVTVLFPNRLFQDNFIRGGKNYSIPGEGYLFDYVLSGPAGVEKVKAIATTERVNLVDLDFSQRDKVFHSAERSAAAKDIQIVEKRVENIPVTGWATATHEFTVR